MSAVAMTVNGKAVTADVDPRSLLVRYLRENLRLTGTHIGCDTSQCGAYVVHVNEQAVKSCTMLARQAEGASVLTIEDLVGGDHLHPMQDAFRDNHAMPCGFCTPGMIISSVDIARRKGSNLDEQTIRKKLDGNFCHCTSFTTSSRPTRSAPRPCAWQQGRRRRPPSSGPHRIQGERHGRD
jgi:aerobic carbon-monoxide dehydrogenase small subunit